MWLATICWQLNMSSRIILTAAAGLGGNTIADVFNSRLYSGTGTTLNVITNIDILNNGGFIWCKNLEEGTNPVNFDHVIQPYQDSSSTSGSSIFPNLSIAASSWFLASSNPITATGWNAAPSGSLINVPPSSPATPNFVSWSFREAEKFFSFVKFVGNDTNRTIAHTLNAVPGMMLVKRTGPFGSWDWRVFHRSLGPTKYLTLNSTAAEATDSTVWNDTAPTSSVFSVGTSSLVNANAFNIFAFLFGHETTTRGLISCDSYTGNGSATGPIEALGWEPQWLMIKRADSTGPWLIYSASIDPSNTRTATLSANTFDAVNNSAPGIDFLTTGFQIKSSSADVNASGGTYVYMAIRSE